MCEAPHWYIDRGGKSAVLAAPDKFRGTLSASAAAASIAAGAEAAGWMALEHPMADGGEGTLEVLGGANQFSSVTGPIGGSVLAGWRLDCGVAVIEAAAASGLALVGGPDMNDPVQATSGGAGDLILAAVARGASEIVVAVGGSATTDGGLGAVAAALRDALRRTWRLGTSGV